MSKYVGCWFGLEEAAEENGEMRIAHAFEAVNDKQAKARAALLFMEAFPDADDSQFDLRIYAAAEGIPIPAEEWDETFLFDHEWDDELGHPVANVQSNPVDFYKLQPSMRVAVLVKYSTTEITSDQLGAAIELQQRETSTFESHIVEAITKMPSITAMYPERILEAIDYIRETCAHIKKWPEIKAVLAGWLKNHELKRKDGEISEVNAVIPRPYEHTHKTLDLEIAVALWAGDVDPNAPLASVTRWANSIIKDDREDWKRWSMQMRTQPNILKYDRPSIFGVVRDAPSSDIYKSPELHGRYIAEYLAEHGKTEGQSDETEQNTAASTRLLEHEPSEIAPVEPQHSDNESAAGTVETAPSVDDGGPFYFLMADGKKVGRANKPSGLKKALADGGTEISQEEYQARKNGTYKAPQEVIPQPAGQTEVNKIADGVFSIDNLMGNQQPASPSDEGEKAEVLPPAATASGAFVLRADELEKELGDSENLSLWKSVMRTNPRYTKDMGDLGFGGTSINAEYMVMRATESFGPAGTGWGWTILEDKMVEGAPLTEKIFEGTKFVGKRILRDNDGTLLFELNHYLRIALWYIKDGVRGTVENFGSTPYRQTTKNGIYCDSEVHKKSLTDAIKKCLSMLGFSADVWLGLYDDAAYKAESVLEFGIKDAAEKADDSTRIREELDERFKQNVETMRKAVSQNEVSKIASSLTRTVGIHLKSAKEINDQEYVKYLEGRLRRLEEVKSECLARLQEKAA
ncbi:MULTISPECIES: exodeoxyribonuclease VIII [Pantoea]|uniref:Exodeoxyribonuclease VIII n=1 Tax=Candidatus Pantoea gossypiicola TaxID=2608008 RepID=A0AB34CGW3_9GAMM|nr:MULTISPECIES: exodeoxyribonuclease VIII [Pantoea]KAA5927827.1 exodeoxyribonuclease VIII [Pantoea sp. VH_8]KAA5932557.1 exodeoxyribonuclease VIII [Pantoea sp. VH_4]KAA5984860.1 exodeoxyribonuclease VIII [Pantoea sp. M_4]KAA6122220.1 exodeoxyribonuclease VIII [Pantoea gossypiicola]